jgi:hypothetical protein
MKANNINTTHVDVTVSAVAPLVKVGIEFPLAVADLEGKLEPDGVELMRD